MNYNFDTALLDTLPTTLLPTQNTFIRIENYLTPSNNLYLCFDLSRKLVNYVLILLRENMRIKHSSNLLSIYSFLLLHREKILRLNILCYFAVLFFSVTISQSYTQTQEKIHLMDKQNLLQEYPREVSADSVKEKWVAIYNGVGGLRNDEALDIAVDSFGNVYITGYSQGLSYDYDCATIKYNTHGEVLWINRFDGGYDDYAYNLALDDSGNVYITGYSVGSGTGKDCLTIKYNTDGVEQWVKKFNGPGNGDDSANDIAVDDSGNVYVTGYSKGIGTNKDYVTIKYDCNGFQKWVVRYNGPANSYDEAYAIDVDLTGNVNVTGGSVGIGTYFDYATIIYGIDGTELWVQRYNGPGNLSDKANALAIDDSGNVFVTGYSDGSGTEPDCCTIKYDSAGEEIWIARYNGPANDWDEAEAIAISPSGNIYITGFSWGIASNYDYVTIKYNPAGVEQWVQRYDGTYHGIDRANDLTIDTLENVYLTGVSQTIESGDYVTIKYDSAGTEQWIAIYDSPSGGLDAAKAIALDESGNVYVTGRIEVPGPISTDDYATIMYSQSIVPVELISFTALVTNNTVLLNWQTATETNNSGFEIERQVGSGQVAVGNLPDGEAGWDTIGFVPGFGTSTEPKTYSFTDNNASSGIYKYRLKQIDLDGTLNYSNTIKVAVDFNPKEFRLYQNYPNPFNSVTNIDYSIAKPSHVTLKIYNSLGEEILELVNEEKIAGLYSYRFDVKALSSGVYFYQLNVSGLLNNYSFVKKFILLR